MTALHHRRRVSRSVLLAVELLEPRRLLTGYYVSPSGSDLAAGTSPSTAFATLQHAADLVQGGDVVNALPGMYPAGFVLGWNFPQNGTAAAPIVFTAQAGATITGRNATTADAIDLEGSSYVTVQGFTITNPSGTITRAGIRAVGDASSHTEGVVISNNTISGMGTWGIFTAFTDDITIAGNTASNSGTQHGIYVSNSSQRPVIQGNTLFGNHGCGIQINADLSQGGSGITSGALIQNNIIHDNGGGAGINLDGVQSSRIQDNLLFNNHASGITLFQIDGATGSMNNLVVNNTLVMAADARWAVEINTGSTGNIVYNNILYNASSHGSIAISSDSLSGFKSDYNVVMNLMSNDDGNTFQTLSQWQNQTGQDLHSIISTPSALFANSAVNDYHLKPGSPAVDAGTSLASPSQPPMVELDGVLRPQGTAYDIGAYELPVAAGTINGTAGTDTITLMQDPDRAHIDWTTGSSGGRVLINDSSGLTINGNGGGDSIIPSYSHGNPLPNVLHLNGTFTINGLQGTNPLAGTTLEIGPSTVYISYASGFDPLAAIQSYLRNGYNPGASGAGWNGTATAGTGVITSTAAANNALQTTAIGYADWADGLIPGQPANTIELKYTLYGDTSLSGTVGFSDFTALTQHYNQPSGGAWDIGDFNYDGSVNFNDFTLLTRTYNTSIGSQAAPADSAPTTTPAGPPSVRAKPPSYPAAHHHRPRKHPRKHR